MTSTVPPTSVDLDGDDSYRSAGDGYHVKEETFNPGASAANKITSIKTIKVWAVEGAKYYFVLNGDDVMAPGTAIQLIGYADGNSDEPEVTYGIECSMDGANWQALPTPIAAVSLSGAVAGDIHLIGWKVPFLRVAVTAAVDGGYFAVFAQ